jgi:hypothetical protein
VLVQRAATGKAETMVSAGRAGEMEGPRWMREVKRLPGRPLERWWKREIVVLTQCAQEKATLLYGIGAKMGWPLLHR